MRRAVAGLVVLVALTMTFPRPARADTGPGSGGNQGWTDGQGLGAGAATPGTPGADSTTTGITSASSSAPVCTYTPQSAGDSAMSDEMAASGIGPPKGTGPGAWYLQVCVDAQGRSTGIVMWLAQPPAVDPAVLAQQALSRTPLGAPDIGLNPPANRDQLVGVTTWLWLNGGSWSPMTASASAGGVSVTTTATPEQVVWSMGEGHSVTCAGPGTAYDPSQPEAKPSCAATYSRSSAGQPGGAFVITVTESWQVAWTATGVPAGGPAGGNLGPVTRTSQIAVRVAESQAINTGG